MKPFVAGPRRTFAATTAVLCALIASGLYGYAVFAFDTPGMALAYLRGERLVADRREYNAGPLMKGQSQGVSFRIRNIGSRAVRVIGGRSSCTCILAGKLPVTIPPRETRTLAVTVRGGSNVVEGRQLVTFYTDDQARPVFRIPIRIRSAAANGRDRDVL